MSYATNHNKHIEKLMLKATALQIEICNAVKDAYPIDTQVLVYYSRMGIVGSFRAVVVGYDFKGRIRVRNLKSRKTSWRYNGDIEKFQEGGE